MQNKQGRRTGLNSGGALRRGENFGGYEYQFSNYVLQKSPGRAEKARVHMPPVEPPRTAPLHIKYVYLVNQSKVCMQSTNPDLELTQ